MGGHSSLLAVRHHQFMQDISLMVDSLEFMIKSLKASSKNVKPKKIKKRLTSVMNQFKKRRSQSKEK